MNVKGMYSFKSFFPPFSDLRHDKFVLHSVSGAEISLQPNVLKLVSDRKGYSAKHQFGVDVCKNRENIVIFTSWKLEVSKRIFSKCSSK